MMLSHIFARANSEPTGPPLPSAAAMDWRASVKTLRHPHWLMRNPSSWTQKLGIQPVEPENHRLVVSTAQIYSHIGSYSLVVNKKMLGLLSSKSLSGGNPPRNWGFLSICSWQILPFGGFHRFHHHSSWLNKSFYEVIYNLAIQNGNPRLTRNMLSPKSVKSKFLDPLIPPQWVPQR